MSIAVYPGSFDPVTLGHVDVVERATAIFDRVIVAVSNNPAKSPMFSATERVELIRATMADNPKVSVDSFDGLTVEYARQVGATTIVKGLRATSDFESEFQQALFNRKLAPEVTTVFLMTSFANVYLSSSLIKQVAMFGGDVSFAVPPLVAERLAEVAARRRAGG
ncbi:MAG TPA: pantetheine-phosphate adenylyltransferase [Candidatus Dormibacteraeota bacterium]|jgi:pantetheine-phosphate adenylyltransferase|nr:pantetheine-phosphate adenylyltransferase [Candidatus Dormibacteraeota bacterium]